MKAGSLAILVAAVLAALAIAVQTIRLDAAERTVRAAAYAADTLAASHDTTRVLRLRVARLGDSVRVSQRRAEQVAQHADAVDRALALERVARDSLTVAVARYRGTTTTAAAESVTRISTPQSDAAAAAATPAPAPQPDTGAGVDSARVGIFDVRQAPYTIHARAELPRPPARGALALQVAVDTFELALRLGCGPPNAAGVRAAYTTVSGPAWASIHLARVEQSPEVCAKVATRASRWAPVTRVLDRIGISVGYVAGVGAHDVGFVGPGVIVGIKLWP